MKTKILAVTDVHQMISKWKKLVEVCAEEKPNVVAIAGDLFPKDTYITGQLPFMKHLRKYATKIQSGGAEIVIILGNDDNELLIPKMELADKEGLWHYLHEKVVKIDGVEFAGMPYVPDYPFGYKYWCHGEYADNARICQNQFTDPVIIDKTTGEFAIIPDYPKYLEGKISIYETLMNTVAKLEDVHKSVWLIHVPPSGMGLDVCCHGARVGSDAVLDFIEREQPLLCIHGHIHESPEYNGHKWCQHNGDTLCIQAGQLGFDLHYSIIEIEDGKIVSKKNSIYNYR